VLKPATPTTKKPKTNNILNRLGGSGIEAKGKANILKDGLALQRINDFLADPGPAPFHLRNVVAAQQCMAHKIMEFDVHFHAKNFKNQTR
jgi:hypothetical protein